MRFRAERIACEGEGRGGEEESPNRPNPHPENTPSKNLWRVCSQGVGSGWRGEEERRAESGDTITPYSGRDLCKVTPVILHGVVSPDGEGGDRAGRGVRSWIASPALAAPPDNKNTQAKAVSRAAYII